jgi:hypothetical protein
VIGDRLAALEARRVLGRLLTTDLQPAAHELLADGYGEDAALALSRDQAWHVLEGELQPFDLVWSVGSLGFVDDIWVDELEPW